MHVVFFGWVAAMSRNTSKPTRNPVPAHRRQIN